MRKGLLQQRAELAEREAEQEVEFAEEELKAELAQIIAFERRQKREDQRYNGQADDDFPDSEEETSPTLH